MFLLIVLGGGLRLNPGSFMPAGTGTPLLIYVFQRFGNATRRVQKPVQRQ